MEDAGTSEEDNDIDSQDSNTPIYHGHLAWNCSIKIITPAVKATVIYSSHARQSIYQKNWSFRENTFIYLRDGWSERSALNWSVQLPESHSCVKHLIDTGFFNNAKKKISFQVVFPVGLMD